MGELIKDLTDEEVLRFARFTVTESAAATFTQATLNTQLSIERGVIWMINSIEMSFSSTALEFPGAGTEETISMQITRESKTAQVNHDDSDLIAMFREEILRSAAIGTDAGPGWYYKSDAVKRQMYSPPIPYANSNIYINILSSAAAARSARGRIGYTLRHVTDRFYFRIAQAVAG